MASLCRLVVATALGVAVAVSVPARAQRAMSVDEIVSRYQEARGGAERIRALQSVRMTGRARVQGLQGTLTALAKRPNLMRQEITLGTASIVAAFDGTTAWTINSLTGSSAPVVLSGQDAAILKMQAQFDSPLIDYASRGYAVALAGTETAGGRELLHLVITAPGLPPQHCFLDSQTFLETRIRAMAPVELDHEPSDYRTIEGLKFPFATRSLSSGAVISEIAVQRVELNPRLDDASFKIPAR